MKDATVASVILLRRMVDRTDKVPENWLPRDLLVQRQVGDHRTQLPSLLLELHEPADLARLQRAEAPAPDVEGVLVEPDLAADLLDGQAEPDMLDRRRALRL